MINSRILPQCCLLFLSAVAAASSSTASPVVVPPSLHWDGDDGQWSTFYASVGSPGQALRLLPGTSVETSTTFWVVIPEGCTVVNPTLNDCANSRGGLFTSNKSTSWSTQELENHADGAIYEVPAVEEAKLGLGLNGSYGYDTVSLGLGVSGLPTFSKSIITGIWTDDYYLGFLPLSPLSFNFTVSNPITSMLGQLRNTTTIPSLSWAYTAGAFYQDTANNKFGSLVLGGYDKTRFSPNNVSFSFGSDITRDLLVKLTSITYNTISSAPLLASPINIYIDSLVSEMWLPVNVCTAFAQAFNLTYNSQGNFYLVDDDTHRTLLAQNPKFNLTLQNGNQQSVSIVMPYASFDLNLTAPIVGNITGYFPIRQAQNESQYVLGRTFLQEAYVIADYERKNFSVSQALFPPTTVQQSIIAIDAPGSDPGSGTGNGGSNAGLSAGAIAGIVVGVVLGLLLLAAIGFLLWRRRKSAREARHRAELPSDYDIALKRAQDEHYGPDQKAVGYSELDNKSVQEMESNQMVNAAKVHESGGAQRYELGQDVRPHELEQPSHEMPDNKDMAFELPATRH